MATASEVAKYILTLADEDEGDLISNLKLQKLIYYCQGFALVLLGRPLFDSPIKAWEHGPVVPEVWHTYREAGRGQITAPTDFDSNCLTQEERDLINEVYDVYGQFSAWKLRNMTHAEPPWVNTERNSQISLSSLAEYFKTQVTEDGHKEAAT